VGQVGLVGQVGPCTPYLPYPPDLPYPPHGFFTEMATPSRRGTITVINCGW
jgi:hypothetical protein